MAKHSPHDHIRSAVASSQQRPTLLPSWYLLTAGQPALAFDLDKLSYTATRGAYDRQVVDLASHLSSHVYRSVEKPNRGPLLKSKDS